MSLSQISFPYFVIILCALVISSCSPGEPYFSGGNQFSVEGIAPEGVKVAGKLWFHNTQPAPGDHMVENVKVFMGNEDPLPVNFGREHVIKIGENARYDVPVVFYVPMEYITENVSEANLLSNKKRNAEIKFKMKGTATVLVGQDRFDMPVDYDGELKVWPDLQ